ncbi:MAG: hypothetical protein JNL98_34600 [Bryobacterales bacterium]|nr:hypothetical protein [Bryobacterales bacterium]
MSMKAGNREVNIFNMSLLDILCGALGAFCFLMLALFPYYSPKGLTAKEAVEQAEQLQKEIEELKRRLANSTDKDKVQALLQKLEGRIRMLQGQLNKALRELEVMRAKSARAEEAERAAQELQKRLEELKAQLEPGDPRKLLEKIEEVERLMQEQQARLQKAAKELEQKQEQVRKLSTRNPVLVKMNSLVTAHDVDLYVYFNAKDAKQAKPDPAVKQRHEYSDEYYDGCERSTCSETWIMRDVPRGVDFEVYYKFLQANKDKKPARVTGSYFHDGKAYPLPEATIPREKTMVLAGAIRANPDYTVTFKPAPEFEQSYKQLLEKQAPPKETKKQ